MLKKTIKYTDFDGNQREEDFYFNLSSAEITEMELSTEGGLEKKISTIIAAQKGEEIVGLFKDLVVSSYGEKSPDGRLFVKSPELSKAFLETGAYDKFFMELVTNADAAAAFVNGILPDDLVEQVEKIKPANPVD